MLQLPQPVDVCLFLSGLLLPLEESVELAAVIWIGLISGEVFVLNALLLPLQEEMVTEAASAKILQENG